MSIKNRANQRESDKMSDQTFKMMNLIFRITDFIFPYIDKRVKSFGIGEGMTIVDYGCGPGRYTMRFSKLVGKQGKVYAADIHELAIAAVKEKITRNGLANVEPVLVKGYDSGIPDHVADMVCAIDMFFGVKEPTKFLGELKRIIKPEGVLIIDDGHQSRQETKRKIEESGCWNILEETRDHLKCH
jgi:ubiquinone/menaquinone biosynthesis C-methylase UbiE